MILEIKVIAQASRNLVKEEGSRLKVYVTAPPEKDKANKAVIDSIASHFKIKKSAVRIIQGRRAHLKTVEITS